MSFNLVDSLSVHVKSIEPNSVANHPRAVHLVQASTLPYLSLKSKSCGCALPDRLPYFLSPWNVFFFFFFTPFLLCLPPLTSALIGPGM